MIKDTNIDELFSSVINNKKKINTFDEAMTRLGYLERHLFLGEIDPDVGDTIESMIRIYNQWDDERNIPVEERVPIKLFIDSPGGDLTASFTIIDSINMSKTPVWTINVGAAYSGGFFVFINGHTRYCYRNSSFLYHEGATEVGGDANKFQNFSDFYKRQLQRLREITLANTKISPDLYNEKRRDDWWIDANEALELGIADKITDTFIY